MQKRKLQLTKQIFKYLMTVAFVTLLIISFFWTIDSYLSYKKQAKTIEQMQLNQIKKNINEQVNSIINFIQYRRKQVETLMREDLKERTYEAYDIINTIYEDNKDSKSKEEITLLIKSALRNIRFNNGRGYYFIDTLEGDVILYPVFPDSEGSNLIDLKDDSGNYALREEINLVKNDGEGFIVGYWKMPEMGDKKNYKKITFVKKFEPYNWYLGCGEYLDHVVAVTQQEIIEYVNSIQYGEDKQQYLFIHDFAGNELANGLYPKLIGANNWDLEDINGIKVCQEQVSLVKESPDGGYLIHYWPNTNGDGSYEKLTFVKSVKEWQWVVGTGQDTNSIKKTIEDMREKLQRDVLSRIGLILFIFCLVILVATLQSKYFVKILRNNINIFDRFMRNASEQLQTIDVDKISYQDFVELAKTANVMTEKINSLLIYDNLTKVYNRKHAYYLLKQLLNEIKSYPAKDAYVLMIDLDRFKNINDNFGHQVGDTVLIKVAATIKELLNDTDWIGRYGGEEFIITLNDVNLEQAFIISEKIRVSVEHLTYDNPSIKSTISGGLCQVKDTDVDVIIKQADDNLYIAKESGRNCIIAK